MKRFSVSCLGTYETCGYKCLRQYNKLGEDKLEDDKNFYGEFGALMHDLFDRYYKDNLTREQMSDMFFNRVLDMECEFPDGKKEKYLTEAQEQFDYFYEKYAIMNPIATEMEFDEFYIDGVPLHFKGFIDRIDGSIEEEEVTLADYKTGSSSKFTKRELNDNIQATVYALWFKKEYGFYPKRFIFIFTKERKTKEIEINEAFIERGLQRIKRITNAIQEGIFLPVAKGGKYFCKNFCKYFDECPKYIKSNDGWDF